MLVSSVFRTLITSFNQLTALFDQVFRNQTSYNRFWDGRNLMTTMITSVRNLTRSFLSCSALATNQGRPAVAPPDETDSVVRVLIAILYATKNHLRADWGADIIVGSAVKGQTGYEIHIPEYVELLPPNFKGLQDDSGVGLPLQLTFFVEAYIKKYSDAGAFHAPQASQLSVQLNAMVSAYGAMETIRLTSVPVAILIHQKQVLALFGCVLPFALVDEMGWWAVPIVTLVCFALYGIDGIARQLEDPFGYDKNDIKVDGLVHDVREETMGLLEEWRKVVGWGSSKAVSGGCGVNGVNGDKNGTRVTRDMFIAPPQETRKTTSGLRARFRDSVSG